MATWCDFWPWRFLGKHGCAKCAPAGANRHIAQAFRTLLRGRVRRSFAPSKARHERVDRQHDKEIDGAPDEDKGEHGIHEVPNHEFTAVDLEGNRREIRLADKRG